MLENARDIRLEWGAGAELKVSGRGGEEGAEGRRGVCAGSMKNRGLGGKLWRLIKT